MYVGRRPAGRPLLEISDRETIVHSSFVCTILCLSLLIKQFLILFLVNWVLSFHLLLLLLMNGAVRK